MKADSKKRYLEYAEREPIDNDEIWRCYQALRQSVAHLSPEAQILILKRAAALATAQEKAAFLAGLRSQ